MRLWKKLVGDQHVFSKKKLFNNISLKTFISLYAKQIYVNHLFLPTLTLLLKTYAKGFPPRSKAQEPENHTKQHSLKFNVQRFFRCFLLVQWKVSEIRGRA